MLKEIKIDGGVTPTPQQVLVAINGFNKGLNLTDKDVTITGIGDYTGSTTVTFSTVS